MSIVSSFLTLRLTAVHRFRLLLLNLLVAAAPARALLCNTYDKPLTVEEATRITGEVKDAYPARVRGLLDGVKVILSPNDLGDVYVATSEGVAALTIPATYLKTQCLLTFGVAIYSSVDAARKALDLVARSGRCPPEISRASCLLLLLKGMEDLGVLGEPQMAKRLPPVFHVLAEGTLKYAIAHEYGHVIVDATWRGQRRPAAFDAELAADLEALQPLFQTQMMLYSDSLLFGGRLLLESFNDADSVPTDDPHEPTICRATRSSLIRTRLLPILARLRRLIGPEAASATQPTADSAAMPITYASKDAHCSAEVPIAVRRIEADLLKLERFITRLPKWGASTVKQWAAIGTLPVDTQAARSIRNAVAANAKLRSVIEGDLTSSAGTISVLQREERLRVLNALAREPDVTDVASREYRTFLYLAAMGRLIFAAPGSSYLGLVVALRDDLDEADKYGAVDMETGSVRAISLFLEGHCDEGFAMLRALEALRTAHTERFSGDLALVAGKAPSFNALLRAFVDLQARTQDPLVLAKECMNFARDFRIGTQMQFGWSN